MKFGDAFRFRNKDKNWFNKLMIGTGFYGLASLLGFPIVFLYGYGIRIVRNVLGGESALPEWDNYGNMAKDGFRFLLAQIVWLLPVFFLIPVFGNSLTMFGEMTAFSWMILAVMGAIGVVNVFAVPGMALQIAKEGTLGSALRFGDVLGFARRNLGKIFKVYLAYFAAAMALAFVAGMSFFTIIGPVLLALAGVPWLLASLFNMFGQVGAEDYGVPGELRVLTDGEEDIVIVRPTAAEAEYIEVEEVEADKSEQLKIDDDINWL